MNIKLTPNETQIFHQLQQAAWTLQSLPADLQSRPAGLRSAWPEMCRKLWLYAVKQDEIWGQDQARKQLMK